MIEVMDSKEKTNYYTDYNTYKMTFGEKIFYILLAAIVIFIIGFIFYRSIIISLILTPLAFLYPRYRLTQIIHKRKKQLTLQFKDMLYSLSSSIGSGNSVETSLNMVLNDMERQYFDPDTFIIKELELMISRLSLNQNIEDIFKDFAERSGVEDIKTFASIFEISKRTGGNLMDIIRQSSIIITEKIEMRMEIDTSLAGRKMEQKVLTIIPIALIWVLTETTEGFMDVIFTTREGRVVATVALIMILAGYLWSKKLTDIEI